MAKSFFKMNSSVLTVGTIQWKQLLHKSHQNEWELFNKHYPTSESGAYKKLFIVK